MEKKDLRLAAIDIGSNALRFQVSRIICQDPLPEFKRLEYLRFPLRLGSDVFSTQSYITPEHQDVFVQVMGVFKSLMKLYHIDDYMACATSAMREAANGAELIERVRSEYDLNIEVISGEREAEIINKAIFQYLEADKNYLHIDVGGGSTEINIYQNHQKIASRSFRLGSVRLLSQEADERVREEWNALRNWIQFSIRDLTGEIIPIGTGGNINKLHDLSEKIVKQKKKKQTALSLKDLKFLYTELAKRNYQERLVDFSLNEDRADIIVPAATIYIEALQAIKAKEVFVPKVGLREGITQVLFEKHCPFYSQKHL